MKTNLLCLLTILTVLSLFQISCLDAFQMRSMGGPHSIEQGSESYVWAIYSVDQNGPLEVFDSNFVDSRLFLRAKGKYRHQILIENVNSDSIFPVSYSFSICTRFVDPKNKNITVTRSLQDIVDYDLQVVSTKSVLITFDTTYEVIGRMTLQLIYDSNYTVKTETQHISYLPGDVDGDETVLSNDLEIMSQYFTKKVDLLNINVELLRSDISSDGVVDVLDFGSYVNRFNKSIKGISFP